MQIEYIIKKIFRKADRIEQIIKKRGNHPGMVHIFSAMEPCATYKPWHDKKSHRTYLQPDSSKCLHYYFYFIDDQIGLCYVRVPTWCPFRLQIYFNGHNWLANQLKKCRLNYRLMDNLFVSIDNLTKAQQIADQLKVNMIHKLLDRFAKQYCPIIKKLKLRYHWSIMHRGQVFILDISICCSNRSIFLFNFLSFSIFQPFISCRTKLCACVLLRNLPKMVVFQS